MFTHLERDLRVVVHVDDFLLSGEGHNLLWFRDQMAQRYKLQVQVAGWGRDDSKEVSFLGRVIRITHAGIELGGDDKHVEMIKKNLIWPIETQLLPRMSSPARALLPRLVRAKRKRLQREVPSAFGFSPTITCARAPELPRTLIPSFPSPLVANLQSVKSFVEIS